MSGVAASYFEVGLAYTLLVTEVEIHVIGAEIGFGRFDLGWLVLGVRRW